MKGIRLFVPAVLVAVLFALSLGSAAAAPIRQVWTQVNTSGFGVEHTLSVSSLREYRGALYAGTYNGVAGPSIYRYAGGQNWELVVNLNNASPNGSMAVSSMVVFNDRLYVATNWEMTGNSMARVWRYDGIRWEVVLEQRVNGFSTLAVYNGQLYVGATVFDDGSGGTFIMRSATGDVGTWSNVLTGGNGNARSFAVTSMREFGGRLYAAVANEVNGVQVWRSANGNLNTWETVINNGFGGGAANADPGAFFVHNNLLYLGVRNGSLMDPARSTGGQLFRTGDGVNWAPVTVNGFGDPANVKIEGMIEYQGLIYAFTSNPTHGMEVWTSADGANWSRQAAGGITSPLNRNTLWNSALAVFNGSLFAGTSNYDPALGGQVLTLISFTVTNTVYLPSIHR